MDVSISKTSVFGQKKTRRRQQKFRFIQKESQCGVKSMSIGLYIGPYFFEDGNGQTVAVHGQRYNDMINDF